MYKVQIKDYLPYLEYKRINSHGSEWRLKILAVKYQQAYGATEVYTDDLQFFNWFEYSKK